MALQVQSAHKPQSRLAEIERTLREQVQHQPHAVKLCAAALDHALSKPRYGAGELPTGARVISLVLSGPSGYGKTQTVDAIRHILGHDVPFVAENFCTHGNETAITTLTGAGSGYLNCDKPCLVDKLAKCLEDPVKLSLLEASKKTTLAYREQINAYNKYIKEHPYVPSLILLHIDELDKAKSDNIVALNSLLDRGYIGSAQNVEFRPTPDTTLLIIFTANFGADAIATLECKDKSTAVAMIQADMKKAGYAPCTIGRFGTLVPYFVCSQAEFSDIIHNKLRIFRTRGNDLVDLCGEIYYPLEVKDFLVDCVHRLACREHGHREGISLLYQALNTLFRRAFRVMADFIDQHGERTLKEDGPLTLFKRTISLAESIAPTDEVHEFLAHEDNQLEIAVYKHRKLSSCNGLGIRTDTRVFHFDILSAPPLQLKINIETDRFEEDIEEIDALKRENERLRQLLTKAGIDPDPDLDLPHHDDTESTAGLDQDMFSPVDRDTLNTSLPIQDDDETEPVLSTESGETPVELPTLPMEVDGLAQLSYYYNEIIDLTIDDPIERRICLNCDEAKLIEQFRSGRHQCRSCLTRLQREYANKRRLERKQHKLDKQKKKKKLEKLKKAKHVHVK